MTAQPNIPHRARPTLTASPCDRLPHEGVHLTGVARAILTATGWAFAIIGGSALAMLALYSAMRGVGG